MVTQFITKADGSLVQGNIDTLKHIEFLIRVPSDISVFLWSTSDKSILEVYFLLNFGAFNL
jgi:hypothetical protein